MLYEEEIQKEVIHKELLYGPYGWHMICIVCKCNLYDGTLAWVADDEHGDGEFAACIGHHEELVSAIVVLRRMLNEHKLSFGKKSCKRNVY